MFVVIDFGCACWLVVVLDCLASSLTSTTTDTVSNQSQEERKARVAEKKAALEAAKDMEE